MRAQDKVVIGWCDSGQTDGAFAATMTRLALSRHDRITNVVRILGSGLLSRIRNELVRTFLEHTTEDWLWMVDTDQKVPVEAFDKLTAAASYQDRPVVAGLVFAAYPGGLYPTPVPAIFRHDGDGYQPWTNYPRDTVTPVDAAGTGCLLVHRRVLETIRLAAPENARNWAWFQDGPTEAGRWLSEDLTFCTRVRAAGFPIAAHTGAVLPHRKAFWQDESHMDAWRAAQ